MSVLLAACGGGGSDEDTAPEHPSASAEGAYIGTLTSNGSNNAFSAVVLETGELWAIYGSVLPSGVMAITGFVQGSGQSANGTYSSSDLRDFGVAPAFAGTSTATYDSSANTMNGTFRFGSTTVGFQGGPVDSQYNYDQPATLAQVTGNWTLNSLTGEAISLSIGTGGGVTGTTSLGCSLSGTLTPRNSGKNVFNAALRFGPAPCSLPNQSASGIALSYRTPVGQQFIFVGHDAARQYGAAAIGIR